MGITRGKEVRQYYVNELPAADGRGFAVEKIELGTPAGERAVYHVYLHQNGRDRSCECKGFLRHGRCKHADGLSALFTR